LLEHLAFDPVLAKCKLIAEAWDAGGLYQVGSFPAYGRWAEWNGKFRDTVRRFIKGDEGTVWSLAQCIQGSPDLYETSPTDSINFITCHDGFTLMDSVSYNYKHNWENGEEGRDGANDNNSWNCGHEGETKNKHINLLRRQQMKTAIAILMVSQGVPMIFMGDEMARSKGGNNNTYCHDSELTWLNWHLLEENEDMFRFFKLMIDFRKNHTALRNQYHFQHQDYMGTGYPDISFHGVNLWQPDWGAGSHSLAFMLSGAHARQGRVLDNDIYVAMNAYWETLRFELPQVRGKQWHLAVDTAQTSPDDIYAVGEEPLLRKQQSIDLAARSVIVLVSKP
jgi:glycogen operon protein